MSDEQEEWAGEVLNGMHKHVKTDVDDMGGDEDGEVQQVDA